MRDGGTCGKDRGDARGIDTGANGEFASSTHLEKLDAGDIGEGGIVRGTRSDDEGVGTHSTGNRRAGEIVAIEEDPVTESGADDVVRTGGPGGVHNKPLGEGVVSLKGLGDLGLAAHQGLGHDLALGIKGNAVIGADDRVTSAREHHAGQRRLRGHAGVSGEREGASTVTGEREVGEGGDRRGLVGLGGGVKERVAEVAGRTDLESVDASTGNNGVLGQLGKGTDGDEVVAGTTLDVQGGGTIHTLGDGVSCIGAENTRESGGLGRGIEGHRDPGAKGESGSGGERRVGEGRIVSSTGGDREGVGLVTLQGIPGERRSGKGKDVGLGTSNESEGCVHGLNEGVGALGIANHPRNTGINGVLAKGNG